MMKKRIEWIDVAKCFGIFAIFLGHYTGQAGKAYEFVYTHHVALFFVLSGFSESLGREENFGKYIVKIIKGLIVPWLLFSVISIVFCNVLLYDNSLQSVVENAILVMKGTIKGQFMASSLWFITCLAVIKLAFFGIKKIRNKPIILLVCLAIHLVAVYLFPIFSIKIPSLPYNIDSASYYLIYFALGYCSYFAVEKILSAKSKVEKILLGVITIFSLYFSIRLYFGWDILGFISETKYVSVIYSIIRPLFVIWIYIVCAYIFKDVAAFKDMGKNTLFLCGSEYLGRVLLEEVGRMLNMPITLYNPLNTVLHTLLLLVCINQLIVPLEKILLNKIFLIGTSMTSLTSKE